MNERLGYGLLGSLGIRLLFPMVLTVLVGLLRYGRFTDSGFELRLFPIANWKTLYLKLFATSLCAVIISDLLFYWLRLGSLLQRHNAELVVAGLTAGAGALAFWFKRRWLLQYGVCEIVFAILSAYNIASGTEFQQIILLQWATLVGAIYVVSRGLGNIYDAMNPKSKAT